MPTSLRVLILEDRSEDAETMAHELRLAGFDPEWRRVDREAEYLAELGRGPKVILADYTLPCLDVMSALSTLKERGLDIPFIVVTGTLDDEAAVECMKLGAADYLLKDRLARLGQAVARALSEKEARRARRVAEDDLRKLNAELEQRIAERTADLERALAELEVTFNSLPDPLIVYDAEGKPVRANPAAVSTYGFDPATIGQGVAVGKLAIRHSDGKPVAMEELPSTRALHGETVAGERFLFTNTRGQDQVILVSASPLQLDGRTEGAVAAWRDVTERERLLVKLRETNRELVVASLRNRELAEQAQRQVEQRNALLRSLHEGVTIVDREGRVVLRNQAAREIFGLSEEQGQEIRGYAPAQILGSDGKPPPHERWPTSRALQGERIVEEEATFVRTDGSQCRLLYSSGSVLDEQGRVALAIEDGKGSTFSFTVPMA